MSIILLLASAGDESKSARVFRTFQTMKEVDAMNTFMQVTSPSLTLLTGHHDLLSTIRDVTKGHNVEAARKELEELELAQPETFQSVLDEGKHALAEQFALNIQATMEVIQSSIELRKLDISKVAGSNILV
jgi:hypothetical protein